MQHPVKLSLACRATRFVLAIVVFPCLLFLGVAFAQPLSRVAEHIGKTDPATEGWIIGSGGSVSYGPVTEGSPATESWYINDPGSPSYYFCEVPAVVLDDFDFLQGWKLTIRIRVVSNLLESYGAIWRQGAGFAVGDESDSWIFDFVGGDSEANDGIWYQDQDSTMTQLYGMDTVSEYHTYSFAYDPGLAQVEVSVDGILRGVLNKNQVRNHPSKTMWFGVSSTEGEGQANYNYVLFEAVRIGGSENQAPTADAGGPYVSASATVEIDVDPNTINLGSKGNWVTVYARPIGEQVVSLDGRGSSDPDGDSLTYRWVVYGANGAEVLTAIGSNPSLELQPGEYMLKLIVSDGQEEAADYTTILVGSGDLGSVQPELLFLKGPAEGAPAAGVRSELIEPQLLMVKFPRDILAMTLIPERPNVVTLSGVLEGQDTVEVIDRPQGKVR